MAGPSTAVSVLMVAAVTVGPVAAGSGTSLASLSVPAVVLYYDLGNIGTVAVCANTGNHTGPAAGVLSAGATGEPLSSWAGPVASASAVPGTLSIVKLPDRCARGCCWRANVGTRLPVCRGMGEALRLDRLPRLDRGSWRARRLRLGLRCGSRRANRNAYVVARRAWARSLPTGYVRATWWWKCLSCRIWLGRSCVRGRPWYRSGVRMSVDFGVYPVNLSRGACYGCSYASLGGACSDSYAASCEVLVSDGEP